MGYSPSDFVTVKMNGKNIVYVRPEAIVINTQNTYMEMKSKPEAKTLFATVPWEVYYIKIIAWN